MAGGELRLGSKMRKFLRSELHFKCLDCYKDTMTDPRDYSVQDDLWLRVCPGYVGHLCITCFRIRLGRNLKLTDFKLEYEINNWVTQEILDEING
jgi:hypothetical protein